MCVGVDRVQVATRAPARSYITDLTLMHWLAAAHIDEFPFLRDAESYSEGSLVFSRTNQTVLQ